MQCQDIHRDELALPDSTYRLLFEQASNALLSVSCATYKIHGVNSRLEDLTGFFRRELVGTPVSRLFPEHHEFDSPDTRNFNQKVLDTPGLHEDVCLRRADDFAVYTAISTNHVELPHGRFAVCVVRDTSARRLLERELITKHMALRQTNEELSEATANLEMRNKELETMVSRMAELSKQAAIGEFTAGVAHNINNPLAAIISSCRQLEKTILNGPSDTAQENRLLTLLKRQKDASNRIQKVIEDMRLIYQNGSPRTAPSWSNMSTEIERALNLFSHRMNPTIRIEKLFSAIPEAFIYPDEIQHLICNLIDNALLAVGEAGTISIQLRSTNGMTVLAIEDSGPGISKEIASRLFVPFSTSRPGGTGLGLSTAQRIAHKHRGKLYCEPGELKGARFVMEIPPFGINEYPKNTPQMTLGAYV